jgi:uncharacterized protein (TIGR02679 family)
MMAAMGQWGDAEKKGQAARAEKAALDFLRQPGFARLWPLVKQKVESYGREAGSIRLTGLTGEERAALEGLLAENMLGRSEMRIPLSRLEQALGETRFRLSIRTALRLLYGDAWMTREERESEEKRSWERFCRWAAGFAGRNGVAEWVRRLSVGEGPGYRVFLECYDEFRRRGDCPDWRLAIGALNRLPAAGERLPVFAARATGDPHGLDRGTRCGRIFYAGLLAEETLYAGAPYAGGSGDGMSRGGEAGRRNVRDEAAALAARAGEMARPVGGVLSGPDEPDAQTPPLAPVAKHRALSDSGEPDAPGVQDETLPVPDEPASQSEKVRETYLKAGIVLDDVSSLVLIAGWGEFDYPVALPLLAMERVFPRLPRVLDLYVVENPSVFGALLDETVMAGKPAPYPLICTSGQPALAALRLFDLAAANQARLHYSGDFDVKGLGMAVALSQRYGERFVPWRFDAETYRGVRHAHLPALDASETALLARMHVPWDGDLTDVMLERRVKVFQEHMLDRLRADWLG